MYYIIVEEDKDEDGRLTQPEFIRAVQKQKRWVFQAF
jgi:hypothetical protein